MIEGLNEDFEDVNVGGCANALSKFFLSEFCDVYIETCKSAFSSTDVDVKNRKLFVLRECFDMFLRCAHPLIPFITEV
jgi:valyl-tRNA synthetase